MRSADHGQFRLNACAALFGLGLRPMMDFHIGESKCFAGIIRASIVLADRHSKSKRMNDCMKPAIHKSSISHPLQIDTVHPITGTGAIGMSICPGKHASLHNAGNQSCIRSSRSDLDYEWSQ